MTSPSNFEPRIVGESDVMRETAAEIDVASRSDAPVLISGEAGCGKTLSARSIHRRGRGAWAPLAAVPCEALAGQELESIVARHAGEGTLVLEEVAAIGGRAQDALYDWLGACETRRAGGHPLRRSPYVRLIATSSRDLHAAVLGGRFREDLYYRLNVLQVCLPPLRRRRGDVPRLVEHFLGARAAEGAAPLHIAAPLMDALVAYEWPGNVAELMQVVDRIAHLATGPIVDVGDLPAGVVPTPSRSPVGIGDLAACPGE